MEWNFATILVLCVLTVLIGAALVFAWKNRKHSSSCCDGNCAACRRKKSK